MHDGVVIRQGYKVSTAVLVTALFATGLLASRAPDIPMPLESTGSAAETAHLVDVGRCHSARRELKFAWLKPGEEPLQPVAGPSSVCLAVYTSPRDQR